MNYDAFRAFREQLLRTRSPRRLDCMNPEVALAHLRPSVADAPAASLDETLARWRGLTGVALASDQVVVGTGIRPLLEALFAHLTGRIETLWLPEDVYPVYWELASHLGRRGFVTLPDVDWSALAAAGPRDALLLPCPLSPAGRALSDDEGRRLAEWLEQGPERRLILDGAYSLDRPGRNALSARLPADQTVALWSLSKPWLSRGILGVASVPPALRASLQSRVALPTSAQLTRASALLERAPALPAVLTDRFAAAWARLAPALRAACPSWRPPESGYFSVVAAPFDALLAQHDLLAIPASVFGSPNRQLSVASCLYDIELHDGQRTA